jgi:adenine-specific DNA-methyltransferase
MFTEKDRRRSREAPNDDSHSKQGISRLVPMPSLSAGTRKTENKIIHGDNERALDAMARDLEGAVKCIYIDPPYNNNESYEHYKDNDPHNVWISSVVSCVRQLRRFLSDAGSIWISIDEKQLHYLKVALDDVFDRENFITTIVWQQRTTRENRKVFSNNHEYVLLYARDYSKFKASRGLLPWTNEIADRFKNPDNDPRGPWQSVSANAQAGHATASQFYELVAPDGTRHRPPNGRCWVYDERRMRAEISKGNIWFGREGNGVPRIKRFLSETKRGITPHTLWLADEVGTNDSAKKHLLNLLPEETVFDTPKPEGLIRRILEIATLPGELVLDAYLGSGTTAAVAQKMGRRYIGIEIGDHIITHCVERLRKVIAGELGGISREIGWTGGGGYEFLRLDVSDADRGRRIKGAR